jgi:hypothetical protein
VAPQSQRNRRGSRKTPRSHTPKRERLNAGVVRSRPVFGCGECDDTFESIDAAMDHQYDAHPFESEMDDDA